MINYGCFYKTNTRHIIRNIRNFVTGFLLQQETLGPFQFLQTEILLKIKEEPVVLLYYQRMENNFFLLINFTVLFLN